MSKLVVNTGSMFSGKSTLLIQQGEKHSRAGQSVLYIKPDIDTRYSVNEIVTHSGLKIPAKTMSTTGSLIDELNISLPLLGIVLIDEVQFFDTKNMINFVWYLLNAGITVYVSGLDMTYRGEAFETTAKLMAIADEVNKLKAVCKYCGADSVVTEKSEDNDQTIELGAGEKYIPVCRECFLSGGY